ncbi:hypothetical protein BaRGS_00038038, partial [Batillaria attramentaria]
PGEQEESQRLLPQIVFSAPSLQHVFVSRKKTPFIWACFHGRPLRHRVFGLLVTIPGASEVEDLSVGDQVNGDLGTMHSGLVDYDFLAGRGSPRTPVKAVHDLSIMFPDNDSGFGSYKSKSRLLSSDDFTPSPSRLSRSRSLSRLNGLTTQEMADVLEKPARSLQSALEDSESRRTVLMHKLKEAQATLELQNDRLSKIENSAKDNNAMVEDLKFKEREYRKKIAQLQAAEEEKQALQVENIRLREEMQDRIESLDFQLKTLKNQHQSTEDDNNRRMCLLDQTSQALTLLEEENTKLQMDRDKLKEEITLMKEAFQLSKSRYDSVESENKSNRSEAEKLREENLSLNKRVHEMAGQMMELRNLLQAVKDDNERLSTSWRNASEDKHRASRQVEGYQDTLADLKSRLAAATADKDRLFQERLDLNQKVQQLILEKEQLLKSQMVLEEQVTEQQTALERSKSSTYRRDDERKHLLDELAAVKRVSEDLSTELASVKAFYERALEQLSLAENGKKLQEQQLELAEHERKRLQSEVDRLSQILDGRHKDDRQERQHLEDTILKMRSEMKDLKYDKEQLSNKNHELETKLQRANEEIRSGMGRKFEDLESWKTTCDRLTASVTRKETELQNLSDKCHSLETQLARAEEELRQNRETSELASDTREELDRLRDENRRLLQEKAENEQMLQLLETQRDVLTKSTESGLNKMQDVEQLSGKVDQMRNENEVLRERILELEKASSELIYKSQGLEELESKMEELREANKQLRDINEVMANKLQMVEQENLRVKHAMGDASSKEELKRLREENKRLLGETTKLRQENSQYVSQTSKETEAAGKELQKIRKERDALQKQVQLINGQLNLLEGSKRRSDDTAQRSQEELTQLRAQLETSRKECAEAKRVATQELPEERSKKPAQIQESLEDVGAELQQMRGELHKLMGEIENKERTIEQLEVELRSARDTADSREHTVSDLKKLVADLEQQNSSLKSSMEHKQTDSSGDERPAFVVKTGEKSLKEELEEAVRSKHNRYGDSKPRSLVRSKSLIPVKLGEGYHARLTVTKDDPQKEARGKNVETRLEMESAGEGETKSGLLAPPNPPRPSASAASTPRFGTLSPTPPETPLVSSAKASFTYEEHTKPKLQLGKQDASASPPEEDKGDTDFPPLTPPSPEDARQKLSFSRPPPPSAVKHRRLPQVRTSGSHLAKAVMIRQAFTKQVEGIIASEAKDEPTDQNSEQTPPSATEEAASFSLLLKLSSSTEGEVKGADTQVSKRFSRKDFAGKPGRHLAVSSSGDAEKREKLSVGAAKVTFQREKREEMVPATRVSLEAKTDSKLMSFDELLGGEGNAMSAMFSSVGDNHSSRVKSSSGTPSSHERSQSSSVKPSASPSQAAAPAKSRLLGNEASSASAGKPSTSITRLSVPKEQSGKGDGKVKSKSASVRDFLTAFSSKEKDDNHAESDSNQTLTDSSKLHRSSTFSGMKSVEKSQGSAKSSLGVSRSWTWHSLLNESDTTGSEGNKTNTGDPMNTGDDEGPRSYAIFDPDTTDPWSMLLDEPSSDKAKMSSTLPTASAAESPAPKRAE